jgi:hypothetical protein
VSIAISTKMYSVLMLVWLTGTARGQLTRTASHRKPTQARVPVVHDHLGAHLARGKVVDTACAVRHVGEEQRLGTSKPVCQLPPQAADTPPHAPLDNVGNRTPVHHEPLGHLQRDSLDALLAHVVNSLGNLKVVVGRQALHGLAEGGVVEDLVGHLVGDAARRGAGTRAACAREVPTKRFLGFAVGGLAGRSMPSVAVMSAMVV